MDSIHRYNDIRFASENLKGRLKSEVFKKRCQFRNITYNLRSTRPFMEESDKRDYIRQAPMFRLIKEWNELKEEMRVHIIETASKAKLKEEVLKYF